MTLSNDQRKMLRMAVVNMLIFMIVYPLVRWLNTQSMTWEDMLQVLLTGICGFAFTTLLFVVGSKIPEKKNAED